VLVVSIASQPLRVNFHLDGRSLIWGLHYDTVHRAGPGADFFALYHAGIMLEHGESPYASKEVPPVTPEFYPFRYLPIVAERDQLNRERAVERMMREASILAALGHAGIPPTSRGS
jgi:hypothetical protein